MVKTLEELCFRVLRNSISRFSRKSLAHTPPNIKSALQQRILWHQPSTDALRDVLDLLLSQDIYSLDLRDCLAESSAYCLDPFSCRLNSSRTESTADNDNGDQTDVEYQNLLFSTIGSKCPTLRELSIGPVSVRNFEFLQMISRLECLTTLHVVAASSSELERDLVALFGSLNCASLTHFGLDAQVPRGFYCGESLEIACRNFASRCSNLESLQCKGLQFPSIGLIAMLGHLSHLTSLHLEDWDYLMVSMINGSDVVFRTVELASVIDDIATTCPHLTTLHLCCRCFAQHDRSLNLAHFTRLQSLTLKGHSFQRYAFPPKLVSLNLTQQIRWNGVQRFVKCLLPLSLEDFVFHPLLHFSLTDAHEAGHLTVVLLMEQCCRELLPQIGPQITFLYLECNSKACLDLVALHCPRLHGLHLPFPSPSSDPMDVLSIITSPVAAQLTCLIVCWLGYLRSNEASLPSRLCSVVEAIGCHCPRLEFLSLAGIEFVTDASLAKLVSSCVSLRYLDLTDCRMVTDQGIQAVVASCPDLTVVQLQQTSVTDASLRLLATNADRLEILGASIREVVEQEASSIAAEILNTTHRVHDINDRDEFVQRVVGRALQNVQCTAAAFAMLRDSGVRPIRFSRSDFVHGIGDEVAPVIGAGEPMDWGLGGELM